MFPAGGVMSRARFVVLALGLGLAALALGACNTERKQECDKFLSALKPVDEKSPSSATLDRMKSDIAAIHFQDLPLGVYAKNYQQSLTVLVDTTKVKEGSSPPDGTNELLKDELKRARTDRDDINFYCSQ
jgi:hypothetical protein